MAPGQPVSTSRRKKPGIACTVTPANSPPDKQLTPPRSFQLRDHKIVSGRYVFIPYIFAGEFLFGCFFGRPPGPHTGGMFSVIGKGRIVADSITRRRLSSWLLKMLNPFVVLGVFIPTVCFRKEERLGTFFLAQWRLFRPQTFSPKGVDVRQLSAAT